MNIFGVLRASSNSVHIISSVASDEEDLHNVDQIQHFNTGLECNGLWLLLNTIL